MQVIWKVALVVTVQLVAISRPALAADMGHEEYEEAHHGYHRNMVEFLLGTTYEDGEHGAQHGLTAGVTYERRFTDLFGAGGFVEYAGGDLDAWTVGVPLFVHPYKEFRLAFAPGFEYRDDHEEFLFRVGVAYEFPISDNWVVLPEFNADFVNGETLLILGITFGFGFGS